MKYIMFLLTTLLLLSACGTQKEPDVPEEKPVTYTVNKSVEVNGRQGVCTENGYYWVSGSKTLAKYDKDWNLIKENSDPFKGYEIEVNHIGDIDVYNNELYIGAEYFMDGVGTNIQVAVYDGDTLELKRTFPFESTAVSWNARVLRSIPTTGPYGCVRGSEKTAASIFTSMTLIQAHIWAKLKWILLLNGSRVLPTMTVISM